MLLAPINVTGTDSAFIPAKVMSLATIDLSAVVHNYHAMKQKTHAQAIMAPALKANAYGLGVQPVARVLEKENCSTFFTATLEEAYAIRSFSKQADIFVLSGYVPGTSWDFLVGRFIPVLISASQVKGWLALQQQENKKLPAVLHLDTGMGRTGLTEQEFEESYPYIKDLALRFIMSHYTNSEHLDHPTNTLQFETLMKYMASFPQIPFSLANSHAFLLPPTYHGTYVRPGISLGGLCTGIPGLKAALCVQSRIVQIKWLPKNHGVGYNNTYVTANPCRVATVALGYADGLKRLCSNRGVLYYGPYALPIIGRVSMDFVTVDVTHVPEQLLEEGEWVTLFHDIPTAQALARAADTTIYELQVTLGSRIHKHYK